MNRLHKFNSSLVGILCSLIAFSLFALMDTSNKFALSKDINFFTFLIYLDLSIVVVIILVGWFYYGVTLFKVESKFVILRAVISVINTFASLLAVSHLPLYMFYSITFLGPIITVVLAFFILKESLNTYKMCFLILGFLGAILVVFSPHNVKYNFDMSWFGLIFAFLVALTNAVNGIIVRRYLPSANTFSIAFYSIILSLLVGLIYILLIKPQFNLMLPPNFNQLSLIFISGLLAGLGMVFSMWSFQKSQVINITHFQYSQMVLGIILGYFIFKDIPTTYSLIGIVIIIISNVVIIKNYNR